MRPDSDINKIWFTADLHFLHPKITNICSRPISKEEHDEWLISRINEKVAKQHQLYILGDVSMGSKTNTEPLLAKIKCKHKFLILGNHDKNLENSTSFVNISQIKNFTFNSPNYPNIHIVLCHYPIASWDRKVHGAFHLYGHTHNRFQNTGLSFDCGVDAQNYYPISLEEVFDKITKISLDLM